MPNFVVLHFAEPSGGHREISYKAVMADSMTEAVQKVADEWQIEGTFRVIQGVPIQYNVGKKEVRYVEQEPLPVMER